MKANVSKMQGNIGNHGGGVFASGGKWALGAQTVNETPLFQRITGADLKKVLANLWSRQRLTKKSHAGRGQETKWEISVEIAPCVPTIRERNSL
jgi:hypothetical protein